MTHARPATRPLTPDERAIVDLLLSRDFPRVIELRRQAAVTQAGSPCGCGCPSIELAVPDAPPRAELRDGLAPVELRVSPTGAEPAADVILFLRDGRLSYLEYVSYGDAPVPGWPEPSRFSLFSTLDG